MNRETERIDTKANYETSPARLPEVHQHQKAESNETAQDDSISPLLGPNLSDQVVHTGYLAGSTDDAPIDAGKSFTLNSKVLVDGICLAEYAVNHVVAVLYSPSLLQHIVGLGRAGDRCVVSVDIGADIGKQIGAVARLGDSGGQSLELPAVVGQDFAVAGEVILFEGGGGEGSLGIEEARELGDERFTLYETVSRDTLCFLCRT